jgi:hypothetical protein
MPQLRTFMIRLLAGLACLLLSACFDIREEVWIHADGSGRAELTYTIPQSAVNLSGGGASITTEGEEAKITLKISTDSMLALRDLQQSDDFKKMPSAAGHIFGSFDVRLMGFSIDFSRTIRVREALGLAVLTIDRDARAKRQLEYIIHLPTPVKKSNATSVTDGGKTLRWSQSLGEAMKQPVITQFRAEIPIPWFIWVAGGLLAISLLAAVIWLGKLGRRLAQGS